MAKNSKEYNKKNYMKYHGNPAALKARVKRVQARRIMEKKWLVSKWDWKEVDHKKWTKAGNWSANLRVISRLKNRQLWQKKATVSRLRNRLKK